MSGAAGLWWLGRPPSSPRDVVHRLWARQGVEKPNVLLVTMDTTRADHLGGYGYAGASTPNLDGLARGGVLFAQAAAAAPLTQPPELPEGYLFLARGLLQESAPIEQVKALVVKGLSLARTPDLKTLGWLLMADVFSRQRQPERMNEALRKAESYRPAAAGRGRR